MASVYLADDLKHDRKVALKVLRPELAAVLGADRFLQEIKTTAQLQHPHILPLYDSGNAAAAQGGGAEFLGGPEVFVRPFPNVNDGKWQVSRGGGSAPLWSYDGRELFYVSGPAMQAVAIHPGSAFSAEPPRALFEIPERVRAGSLARGTFAITPDGRRFLMVRDNSWREMAGTPTLVVVENFFEELRSKLKK